MLCIDQELPLNSADTGSVLVVILWWKCVSLSDTDFMPARDTPINPSMRSADSWLVDGVKSRVVSL